MLIMALRHDSSPLGSECTPGQNTGDVPKEKNWGKPWDHNADFKAVFHQTAPNCLVFCIIRIVTADINIGLPRDQMAFLSA